MLLNFQEYGHIFLNPSSLVYKNNEDFEEELFIVFAKLAMLVSKKKSNK